MSRKIVWVLFLLNIIVFYVLLIVFSVDVLVLCLPVVQKFLYPLVAVAVSLLLVGFVLVVLENVL